MPHALRASIQQPLPSEHPFYVLIGRVAAEWAKIEHILDLAIWDLCAVDHRLGSCITGQLAGQFGRFGAIQALARAKGFDKKMLGRIENFANSTNTLARRRNRFVHDAWYETGVGQTGQFRSYSAKEGVFGFYEVKSGYAEETIALFKQKAAELSELCSELLQGPPATPSS